MPFFPPAPAPTPAIPEPGTPTEPVSRMPDRNRLARLQPGPRLVGARAIPAPRHPHGGVRGETAIENEGMGVDDGVDS